MTAVALIETGWRPNRGQRQVRLIEPLLDPCCDGGEAKLMQCYRREQPRQVTYHSRNLAGPGLPHREAGEGEGYKQGREVGTTKRLKSTSRRILAS